MIHVSFLCPFEQSLNDVVMPGGGAVAVHNLVVHSEAEEVFILVAAQLGDHHSGSDAHGGVVHWRVTRHHRRCLHFQILPVKLSEGGISKRIYHLKYRVENSLLRFFQYF